MYICICNAIPESTLREAAHLPGDAEAVYAALGYKPQCRTCLEEANHILAEERRQATMFTPKMERRGACGQPRAVA